MASDLECCGPVVFRRSLGSSFGIFSNWRLGSPFFAFSNLTMFCKGYSCSVGEAQWPHGVECSTPDRVVRVRVLAGDIMSCVLGQDTLLSQCLSPPRCINGYRQNAGGNPAMH